MKTIQFLITAVLWVICATLGAMILCTRAFLRFERRLFLTLRKKFRRFFFGKKSKSAIFRLTA